MSNIETLTNNAMNNGEITLTVDEPSRKLQYEGELVLGVEHDCRAERVYFEAPQIVGDNIDLSSEDVKIFIDYKNGYNEPYCVECTDRTLVDGVVKFSWLLGSTVTEVKGDVTFTVCVKKIIDGEDFNIWHTIPFVGKVIKGVEPSDHEVIEDTIVDTAKLREEVKVLQQNLTDAEATIQAKVDAGFVTLKSELQNETDPVVVAKANYATKAAQDADGNMISDTYVKNKGNQVIEGSLTVDDTIEATNINVEAQVTANSVRLGGADEVVLDPGDGIFTINNKNILTDPVTYDFTSQLQEKQVYDGSLNKDEYTSTTVWADEVFYDSIYLESGDKIRFYLNGHENGSVIKDYNKFNAGIIEVELFEYDSGESGNRKPLIGRNSITCIRDRLSYQCLCVSLIVEWDQPSDSTALLDMTFSIYALSDSYSKERSRICIEKAEVVKAQ